MDGLVVHLSRAFSDGDKALIFVRRVASVRELRRKLERCYDDYLIERLRRELSPDLAEQFEVQVSDYGRARERHAASPDAMVSAVQDEDGDDGAPA